MRLFKRKIKPIASPATCTCHVFDMGPRCEACQVACAAAGHPKVPEKTNGQDHMCGVILGRRQPCKPPVSTASERPGGAA